MVFIFYPFVWLVGGGGMAMVGILLEHHIALVLCCWYIKFLFCGEYYVEQLG